MQLDALIVEGRFDEAEDYLEGIILATSQDRDTNRARHYEQYRKVIMTERLFHDQSKAFQSMDERKESQTGKISSSDIDLRQPTGEVKQEDLPEGWKLSE